MDREKVITALEFCTDTKPAETCFGKCPYAVADDDYRCRDMKLDALTLLKEQEPKPVIQDRQCEVAPNVWERKGYCPNCRQEVLWTHNRLHCGFCGKPVLWESR